MCDMFWLRPQPLFTDGPRSHVGACCIYLGVDVIRCGKNRKIMVSPSHGFLASSERAEAPLFTCRDSLFLARSQGVSCLLFYDFLITSHGSLRKLTATRLPAEFYIREWMEWIIKGSHLEIMKRSKMPMLIAQGAGGITRRCYCYFLNIIVGCEMWFAGEKKTSGSSGSRK